MNTEKVVKETKIIMGASLIVSIALLAVWIIFSLMDNPPVSNTKALIALSLIPLSVALSYFLKFRRIKKFPTVMTKEIDERLVAQKNESDALAFKILQGLLFLSYMGYTFIVPEDVFKTIGWWILLVNLLVSFFSQGIFRQFICKANNKEEKVTL